MGTAFGLLLVLVFVTVGVRIVSGYISARGAGRPEAEAAATGADARDKALAAVVGVTAVLAQRDRGNGRQPDGA